MLYALAALLVAASPVESRWTFCVAESGDDVWITSVFALTGDREKLEGRFGYYLRSEGVAQPALQCPAPNAERGQAFNAQFVAAEFHRKLGHTLHTIDWPPRKP